MEESSELARAHASQSIASQTEMPRGKSRVENKARRYEVAFQ